MFGKAENSSFFSLKRVGQNHFVVSLVVLLFAIGLSSLSAQSFSFPLKPQTEEYFFEEIRFPEGTAVRDVRKVLQDNNGFVWMAGSHGLYRYDGHDFKLFRYDPRDPNSIIDTDLLSLYLHADTLLCIGGVHGISLMDVRTGKVTNISCDLEGNPLELINDFFSDSDETIWMGGLNGLYSLAPDMSGVNCHHLEILPTTDGNPAYSRRVYCMAENSRDNNLLMLGTEYGLVAFDKKKNLLYKGYPNTKATFWRSHPAIYKFIEDGDYLWALCWISGMPRFDMVNEQWENLAYPQPGDRLETTDNVWAVSDFMVKNDREFWLCDLDRGLFLFDKKTEHMKPLEQSSRCAVLQKSGLRIFMLRDGSLWLGNNEGLWRQNRKAHRFVALDIPFSHKWVSAVLHDATTDEYYFGLNWESYGVSSWNGLQRKWTFYQTGIERDKMLNSHDIIKDSEGVIWVATSQRGLWYLDKNDRLLKPFSLPDRTPLEMEDETIYKIFEDRCGNLWLGTRTEGVVRINSQRTRVDYYRYHPQDSTGMIAGTHITAIAEDRWGRIWIGNQKGFCTFDPQTETFSQEIARQLYETGVRPGKIYSMVTDSTGSVWMTATGQGLIQIRETEKNRFHFKIFQTDDGLKDLSVRYMTTDMQGNLWLMNNGLLYFNPYDESFLFTDERNGLLNHVGGDDRITVDHYGNLFVGRQMGVKWSEKAKMESMPHILNLIIENILIDGKPVYHSSRGTGKIRLSKIRNGSNVTFDFTAICFDEYDQVRYRYRLEGLETAWSPPVKTTEARYANLPQGAYRFVVDVAYKGNWMKLNRSVDFTITPPFWETKWFAALLAVLVSAILYLIYRIRVYHLEKQERIRLKIASDLHDDIGSTLSSISIMSELLQSQPQLFRDNSYAEGLVRTIGENACNMLESMDDIIWSVNPSNDRFSNLVLRIREYVIPLFESKEIRFTIKAPDTIASLHLSMEVRRNVFLIVKEAVNNMVKYSDCTTALIDFSCTHSWLKVTVSDDGKGFDTSRDTHRNGLRNMKVRAEKIGGDLTVCSAPGKGTTVALTVKTGC